MVKKSEKSAGLPEFVDAYADKLAKDMLALDWESDHYLKWITQHYHLVRRTMRFINLGAGLSEVGNEAVYSYWMHHLKDEINHHKVLEKDAEKFGIDLSRTDPLPITKAAIASIYYGMIDSRGIYLFGYGPLLEGLACKVAGTIADIVEKKFEKGTAKFLRLHAEVDDGGSGHYAKIKSFMETLGVEDKKIIRDATEVSYSLYSQMLKEISAP